MTKTIDTIALLEAIAAVKAAYPSPDSSEPALSNLYAAADALEPLCHVPCEVSELAIAWCNARRTPEEAEAAESLEATIRKWASSKAVAPRPLSHHALRILADLVTKPRPAQSVNAGVSWKLRNEGLAELVSLPSPYPTHKGKPIWHLRVTPAGVRRALA